MKFLPIYVLGLLAWAGCCRTCTNQQVDGSCARAVSPDGRNEIRLYPAPLSYEVRHDGRVVAARTPLSLKVNGTCLASTAGTPAVTVKATRGVVPSPVYKKAQVSLAGEESLADFGTWGVRLAARNDGVAYRFETKMPGKIRIDGEKAGVTVPEAKAPCRTYFTGRWGCEETVNETLAAEDVKTDAKGGRMLIYLPFVYTAAGTTVAVTESDVNDYPVWNLARPSGARGADGVAFDGRFAPWPAGTVRVGGWGEKTVKEGGRWLRVTGETNYLVETAGTRTFPWRTFVLADEPSSLCAADIVWALARPANPAYDFSWVKPGKVAWDWWNDWNLAGVPFKAGCNTKSYEYYIDFAAKTGVEYVIFDEGWSESLNIWKDSPAVDVDHLIQYANRRGVGIILWMAWAQVAGNEEKVAAHFAKKGAKGFKVDFMDRGDADVEEFLWRFAEACRKNRMLVDYHGAHRPTGLSRAYPNVINYEGVHGLEQMKWYKGNYDMMANDLKCFYGRMTAGPMDYTPGAMRNFPIGQYKGSNHAPGSCGTRCRQIAMMTLFEAPLQMLCDSPTNYEKEMESFRFMAVTPVTWADTVGLGGTPETYAALARKAKDGAWYAAGMSNKDARDVTISTDFLGEGVWNAEIFRDAESSDTQPETYVHETKAVTAGTKMVFHLAKGGGFAVRFTK